VRLDSIFGVIVVDYGSSDDSLIKLEELKVIFPNLRTKYLERNPSRSLAGTRNISVREASGYYCLLHIDCDDVLAPYLLEFVKVFHSIEQLLNEDVLLCCHQFIMGKREFLLEHGPYKYGHMVEDRDMWYRLGLIGKYIPIDHVVFRHRMPLSTKQQLQKKYLLTGKILSDAIRAGNRFSFYLTNLWRAYMKHSLELRIYKVLIYPLCFIRAKKLGPIKNIDQLTSWNEIKNRAREQNGTVFEIFSKRGSTFDSSILSPQGKWIFSHKAAENTISSMPQNL